jgi:CBS domain-containing protein/sporulation protein YlmC with PRC-barrel domain
MITKQAVMKPMITDDIFLSELLNRPVLDRRGNEIGKIKDLNVIPGETFPVVEGLYLQSPKGLFYIPIYDASVLNKRYISLQSDISTYKPVQYREGETLVGKHIMDKQVVDVNGVKVVRVNDVHLGWVNNQFGLLAIDVGFGGLLRRVGFGRTKKGALISWQYLKPLEPGLDRLTLTVTRTALDQMHPFDIAEIVSQISIQERSTLLNALDKETAGDVISELDEETQVNIIKQMEPGKAADVLEAMNPDEAADVLGEMPEHQAKELLDLMEKEEAADVQELLEHDEDTAGGLMTTDYLSLSPEATTEDAIREIRLFAPDIEMIYYIYVLDSEDRLEGVLSLKDLLIAASHTKLADIMTANPKKVPADADKKEVAELVSKYNLIAVPVVDEDNHLLGIITVDDIVDILLPNPLRRRR